VFFHDGKMKSLAEVIRFCLHRIVQKSRSGVRRA
jgi:cytochrome c peroxidase